MVVEHLNDPAVQFRDVWRILEPKGLFIFHTPNALSYTTMLARMVPEGMKGTLICLLDGRAGEDVFPAFYRANTRNRIADLARTTGFEVEEIKSLPHRPPRVSGGKSVTRQKSNATLGATGRQGGYVAEG